VFVNGSAKPSLSVEDLGSAKSGGVALWAGNAMAPSPQAVITAASLAAGHSGLSITREAEPLKGRSGRTLPAPYAWRTGGSDIKLVPRPGLHSDADLIVYFPAERVVDMGDLLLSESVPAVEDIAGYLAFLDDVLDVFPPETTFISGHGRDLDAAGVRAYRDALTEMIGIIRANVAAGRTAEQMVNDGVLKAYKPRYSLLAFLSPDTLIPRVMTALQRGALKQRRAAPGGSGSDPVRPPGATSVTGDGAEGGGRRRSSTRCTRGNPASNRAARTRAC
jgi:glyoxylase-like metal-dependent hydrolase (beta-lactamase superfamily II)